MKIEEMKKKRYQFLHKLYDLAGCDSTKLIEVYKVGDELGFDRGLTDKIAQFLKDERMIKFETFAPGDFGYTISITHLGIQKVENYKRLIRLFDLNYIDLREKYEKEIHEKAAKITEDFSARNILRGGVYIKAIFDLYSKTYKKFLDHHVEDLKSEIEDEESLTILSNHLSDRIPVIVNNLKRKMKEVCIQRRAGEKLSRHCESQVDELKQGWLIGFNRNLEIYKLRGFKKNSFSEQAFVLMPFEEPFNSYYEKIIKPSIEKTGIKCLRADEIYKPGDIPEQILDNLKRSKVIVADITEENLNVVYEVGVAHTSGRDVIFLTQKKPEAAPFDFRHHRIIQYNPEEDGWELKLEEELIKYIKSLL